MKFKRKLLSKWFPTFFNTCIHNNKWVDHTKYEGYKEKLRILLIDPEEDNIFGALGIHDDRAKELVKEVQKAVIDCNSSLETIEKISHTITHINEFYACTQILEREMQRKGIGGLGNILNEMMRRRGSDGDGSDILGPFGPFSPGPDDDED